VDQSVVLKITSNYPDIFRGIQKHYDYLNNLYHANKIPFFLEEISKGFVFIVRNMEFFEKIRDPSIIKRKLLDVKQNPPQVNQKVLDILANFDFQQNNLIFNIECDMKNSELVFDILQESFNKINTNIRVSPTDFNLIQIEFKSRQDFIFYIQHWISLTADLVKNIS